MMELLCEQNRVLSPQTELIEDYVSTVADIESRKPAEHAYEGIKDTAAYRAGVLIAQSYIQLSVGQQEGYTNLLRVKKDLEPFVGGIRSNPREIMVDAALDVTINNLGLSKAADKEAMATFARRNLHLRTVEVLGEHIFQLGGVQDEEERSDTIGSIVELTALGVLNRDPDVLGMPALPHHDIGLLQGKESNDNIDLTATRKVDEDASTRQIQTKAGCLRFHRSNVPLEQLDKATREAIIERCRNAEEYAQNGILVLSGCCDFDMRFKYNHVDSSHMLIREALGQATSAEVAKLDRLTHNLRTLLSAPRRVSAL